MENYHIGLPAWAFPGWSGTYFDNQPTAIASYSKVFNTVEGNTTFYSIPDKETINSWYRVVTNTEFRFCFKLPREVTHQRHVDYDALDNFCRRIAPLRSNLGPILLQFRSTIGPREINIIASIAARVREQFSCVLEVRHPDFFRQPEPLISLLESHRLALATMDSRAVFHGDQSHPEVRSALHEKPDVPVWNQVYNGTLFVRLLLHPDRVSNAKYIAQWVRRTAKALTYGSDVYMMIHCPNNQHCPDMALQFHGLLRKEIPSLPALNPWPVPSQQQLL